MPFSYYLGLDLGQSQDYTALAVVEEPVWVPSEALERLGWAWQLNIGEAGWVSPSSLSRWTLEESLSINYHYGRPSDPPLSLRHLERFELGTRYPDVIDRVRSLLSSGALRNKRVALLVDKTGVGASVVDSLARAGLLPIAVTIHGGSSVSRDEHGYRVPKRDLVSAVQVLLQNGRLKIAEGLPLAETLRSELLNFRLKIDPKTAHDSYEHWREADHDDLVLAVAMACWHRQWFNSYVDAVNAGVVEV
jgi:hypothetical protein